MWNYRALSVQSAYKVGPFFVPNLNLHSQEMILETPMNLRNLLLVAPAALLAACGGKTTDTGDTAPQGCGVTIYESVPTTDAADHYYRAPVEFHLTGADDTAVASLTDASGAAVSGTSSLSGDSTVVYFAADSELSPSSTYTAGLTYCSGDASVAFSTSSLGGALESDILGNTYALDLSAARFVKPEGVGVLLQQYVTQEILAGVTNVVSGEALSMLGAIAEEGSDPTTQDYCTETFDFPTADFSEEPYFVLGPATTPLTIAGFTVNIGDMLVSGTFAADGSYFGGGVLSGEIDGREVSEAFDEIEDSEALCALAASVGATCEACTADGEIACLSIEVDQINAAAIDDLTLVEVAASDCHELCSDNADDCDLGGVDDTGLDD